MHFSEYLCISMHISEFLCISLHCSAFLCISLHFTAFHCIFLHSTTFLYISLHFSSYHCIFLHFSEFLCISLHFTAFFCISVYFSAFLCILRFIFQDNFGTPYLWFSLHWTEKELFIEVLGNARNATFTKRLRWYFVGISRGKSSKISLDKHCNVINFFPIWLYSAFKSPWFLFILHNTGQNIFWRNMWTEWWG